MKKLRTILILVLCMIIGTSVFAGCNNKNENKEDTLYAVCINKGYGTDWVNALLKRFCELNPEYKYDVEKVYDDGQIKDKIEAGSQYCRWDLAFNGATYAADTDYLLSLNEIYNYEYVDGSRAGTTVISNVDDNALKGIVKKVNGQDVYYALPWTAEVGGICVNNDAVKAKLGNDWKNTYPCRTTDELLEFCSALKKAGLEPFMHSATNDYYGGISRVWFAQYNGENGVSNYFEGRFSTPLGYQVGPAVAKNQGVLKAYEVLEAIGKGGYYYSDGYGLEWDVAQTLFMSGAAAMLPIGDWVQTEMNKQYPNVDVQFIRYPVLTALATDKLGITDDELSNVIAYVDGEVNTKPSVNSTKGLTIPKHYRTTGQALTRQEEKTFIEKIKGHRFEETYLKMLYSGVRPCEVNTIQENIDDETIKIENGKLKNYQKNKHRVLPIFPLYKPYATGKPIKVSQQKLGDEFGALCPNHTLKDLRHTFTTRARECGVDNELVAVWTGHSLGNITSSVYTHFSMEFQKEQAKKIIYTL